MGGEEVEKVNINHHQEVWDSQGEGGSRAVPAGEDVEGGFYLIWERAGHV